MHALEPGLAVELTLNSPTCIAQLPTAPGQVTETTPYLTGTVIRGGLATLWLRGRHYAELNPAEQQQFRQIFLNDDVTFQHAWPVDSDADGQTWIVPATAWTQKRHEGWLADTPRPGGGVRDALVAMLNGSIMTDTWRDWDRVDPGFVSESGGRWRGIRIHRRLITRTALNRIDDLRPLTRGVTIAGQLYTFEALEVGQVFRSRITGPETVLTSIQNLLQPSGTTIGIGQGRSRGAGQVQISVDLYDLPQQPDAAQQADLVRVFSSRANAPDGWLYLPITLEADMVLRDRYLIPCTSGDPQETLWRYLPPDAAFSMHLHDAVQTTHMIGGWDALRRLPRPVQLAVRQGSVWVYKVPEADLDRALAWWQRVEMQGIGERRTEGYGRVRLLHPLHQEDELR